MGPVCVLTMEGFEEEEEWGSPIAHLTAGAIAGTVEHCGMFPLDTIKTHMQAFSTRSAITSSKTAGEAIGMQHLPLRETVSRIIHQRGFSGFFRGLNAMVAGAAPAHAVYFCMYELFKGYFGGKKLDNENHTVAYFSAGVVATVFSDAVFTPMDAMKQKLQLGMKDYKGVFDCCVKTFRTQGLWRGFYSGYTATLFMNIPYSGVYFASYEFFKRSLAPDRTHSNMVNCIAGGGAGILAAGLTNPLDVARTRLQTQSDVFNGTRKYLNMHHAVKVVWREEGWRGFTPGIAPRMMFHSTSAAICWATYEYVKFVLTR